MLTFSLCLGGTSSDPVGMPHLVGRDCVMVSLTVTQHLCILSCTWEGHIGTIKVFIWEHG